MNAKKVKKMVEIRFQCVPNNQTITEKPLVQISRNTQNEKLSKGCQTNCHYDNFIVVIQKVV